VKLTGMLSIMSLPDLLQWIKNANKTGCLHVAHKSVSRNIYSRNGHIVACTSDDPSILLGQFLLCHGRISEETLREGLKRQEHGGKNLGGILVEMGALREDQLTQIVTSKAMETIHGIFDWEDASFEFVPDATLPAGRIEVDLGVDEVLLEGMRRVDEMAQLRKIFTSPRLVLKHTDRPAEAALLASPVGRKLHDAIDGRRTLAEVVLLCHASEFMAFQFLSLLLDRGALSIVGTRELRTSATDPALSLDRARQLVDQGEFLAAIEILRPLSEANPNESSIKTLLADAEAKFLVKMYRGGLHPGHVPATLRPLDDFPLDHLTGAEAHLLERIDGTRDIKSILWVVPMRPVEVLASLKSLVDRGLIEVRPAAQPSVEIVIADAP
jgi:hypothetical protein